MEASPPGPEAQTGRTPDLDQTAIRSLRIEDFAVVRSVPTRWADVDTYGHVNNAVHYELMDTAVNGWLVEVTRADIRELTAVGWVVETSCRYVAQLHFPSVVRLGIALERLGTTSIVYRLAIFGEEPGPAALGRFVHVYVDRRTERPAQVPAVIRSAVSRLRPLPSAASLAALGAHERGQPSGRERPPAR